VQISKTFLDLGYSVDVINYLNTTFTPEKNYAFFIDPRQNLERIAPLLNKDCVKILHIDIAHVLYHDFAEVRRLFELQQRRGVTLRPRRFEIPNLAIEYADCAICLGNEFTVNTYKYAKKPIYRVPISTPTVYPWFEEKDFGTCRKNFLWLNNHGLVHKGLDLILEAFSEMPDYHLTVCGPVEKEKDFVEAFYRELFKTPNIHTIGWVDITSERFSEIIKNNVGIISVSCSEAGGGSIITGMHAGLIPIANYESSVDMNDDYGILLEDCSIGKIRESIKRISALPASEIKGMARRAWEFSRKYHTRERFAEEYRKTIVEIIKTRQM
jgi:glycosyltransferase involved in cell wall biosynthesis